MVIQKVNYTNLDGIECSEAFAFNLGQQDYVRLELRYQPDIQTCYEKMVSEGNLEGGYDLLADLIESSYGVREGSSFVKNRRFNGRNSRPDLANFMFHPAFEQLMVDLLNDPELLLSFFRDLTNVKMPKEAFDKFAEDIRGQMKAEELVESTEEVEENGSSVVETTEEVEENDISIVEAPEESSETLDD